ncbi:hypothetical protein L596_002320 [Steinernema carpocapsae]|uniref:Uncharacterized protein n=1 Tax=Steinernema carpocapsae TaxID=34508 RepID=A0A4V6I7N9_STECR|nr:hypothetical protein L596_002320 [Steinernema carpocapsae]
MRSINGNYEVDGGKHGNWKKWKSDGAWSANEEREDRPLKIRRSWWSHPRFGQKLLEGINALTKAPGDEKR